MMDAIGGSSTYIRQQDQGLQFKIVQSNRGKQNLLRNGFTYRLDHTGKDRISWRCSNRKCAAQLKTDIEIQNIIQDNEKDHCHDADGYKLERQLLRVVCKRKAVEEMNKRPGDIIKEECQRYGYVYLSSKDTKFLELAMYRARKNVTTRNKSVRQTNSVAKKDIQTEDFSVGKRNVNKSKLQSPSKSIASQHSPTQDDPDVSELFQQPFDNHFDIFNTSGFDQPSASFSGNQHSHLPNTPQHVPSLHLPHTPTHDPSSYSFAPLALSQPDMRLDLPLPSLPLAASIMQGLTDKPPDLLVAVTEDPLLVKKKQPPVFKDMLSFSDLQKLEVKMNDKAHYIPFRRALQENQPKLRDSVVLDIGAGCGLLSHFAMQAGAGTVFAVEPSSLAECARRSVADNNFVMKVIQKHVKDLTDADLHLLRVNVLISDWMIYHA